MKRRTGRVDTGKLLVSLCISGSCCLTAASAGATSFAGLGVLTTDSGASDVSVTGVVVGWSGTVAFRWTPASGMVGLGAAGADNRPIVSGNGLVVAGSRVVGGTNRMFRWTEATGAVSISPAGEECFRPSSIDFKGDAVTALGSSPAPYHHHCRWTALDGFTWIEGLPEVGQNHARRMINLAGTAVVGVNHVQAEPVGFLWTTEVSYLLCAPVGEGIGCVATAENQAADVVVGTAGTHGFRWTAAGGRVDLGDLAGGEDSSAAADLDETGLRVVGWGSTAVGREATIWDAAHGNRRVLDLLALYDVVPPSGWRLRETTAISADGRYLAGFGDHDGATEAWRVELAALPEIVLRLRNTVQSLSIAQTAANHRAQLSKWLHAAHVAALLAERPSGFQKAAQKSLRQLLIRLAAKLAPAKTGGWIADDEVAATLQSLVQDALLWTPVPSAPAEEALPVATRK